MKLVEMTNKQKLDGRNPIVDAMLVMLGFCLAIILYELNIL